MGFFSWNCEGCKHPLISRYALEENNEWMNDVVILTPDGSVIQGEYDGYGRAGEYDYGDDGGEPQVYHKACWQILGEPTEYTGASERAGDQGYFFDENTHNLFEPLSIGELENIKIAGVLAEKNCCQNWEICHLSYVLGMASDYIAGSLDKKEKERFLKDLEAVKEKMDKEAKELEEKIEAEKREREKELCCTEDDE